MFSSQAPVIEDATPYNAAFVNAVYLDTLGRAADLTSLNSDTQQLNAGTPRVFLPATVIDSNEYAADVINAAYQKCLGRAADDASLNYWTQQLHAGLRDEDLYAVLVGSDEFYSRAGGSNSAWIHAAFEALLGRPVDSGGLAWANSQLNSGVSRSELALMIADGTEREEQVVRNDYLRYWSATPDNAALTYWAQQIGTGQATQESLLLDLMNGNQYYQQTTGASPTIVPEPVPLPAWETFNAQIDANAAKGNAQVVFLGDSITYNWQTVGPAVWQQNYASFDALNAGISGDRTQNLIWRIEHGNLGTSNPKIVVLMVGVNNLGAGDSPQDTATGVASVVAALRDALPNSKILLLAILPAFDEAADGTFRQEITATNQLIQKLADNQNVFYLDMGPAFTDADGNILPQLFQPVLVHPNQQGYEVWAQTMNPYLDAIMALPASQKTLL